MPAEAAGGPPQLTAVLIATAGAAGIILLMAGALAWAARLIYVSNIDAYSLADKISRPEPVSALDWPELQVRAVIPSPDGQLLVLLYVGWTAHPHRWATLLVALDSGDQQSLSLLSQWCNRQASVCPMRQGGTELELRRRQTLERVHVVLVAEDTPHFV
jgi:hypothetical protein